MKFWGGYKFLVGVLATAESLLGILRSVNPPETSIWGALTVAAAMLLAVDGLTELLPNVHRLVFVALAAVSPLLVSVLSGDAPSRLWMFAVAVGFAQWVFLELKRTTERMEIGSMACCLVLAASLANTTILLFRMYWNEPEFWPLGQIFHFMVPIVLPWTLLVILLLHSLRELKTVETCSPQDAVLAADSGDD